MAKRAYWCSTGGEPRSSGQSILAMRTLNAYVAEGEKKRRLVVAMVIVSPSYTLATRAYFMSGCTAGVWMLFVSSWVAFGLLSGRLFLLLLRAVVGW